MVAEGCVASAGGNKCEHESRERFWQYDRFATESQPYLGLVGEDVVGGESTDRGVPLRVEHYEQPSDAVLGFDGAVVEQPACLVPAGLTVNDGGWSAQRTAAKSRLVSSLPSVAHLLRCHPSGRSSRDDRRGSQQDHHRGKGQLVLLIGVRVTNGQPGASNRPGDTAAATSQRATVPSPNRAATAAAAAVIAARTSAQSLPARATPDPSPAPGTTR